MKGKFLNLYFIEKYSFQMLALDKTPVQTKTLEFVNANFEFQKLR